MTGTRKLIATKIFLSSLVLILALFGSVGSIEAQKPASNHAWITILSTTDVHGNIYPVDY